MEPFLKDIVKKEVAKALKEEREQGEQVNSNNKRNDAEKSIDLPAKKQKVAVRLNNLLTSINKKAAGNLKAKVTTKKSLRIQVRYQRTDEDGFTKMVRQNEGGGARFITFEPGDDPVIERLRHTSMNYFFQNEGRNYFNELVTEIDTAILDPSGSKVDTMLTINQYLLDKGLTASRAYFILASFPRNDLKENSDDSDSAKSDNEVGSTLPNKKICPNCFKTYHHTCLSCEQDIAFEESLRIDRQKQIVNDVIDEENNAEENSTKPNEQQLREMRLKAFQKISNVQETDLTELSKKFLETEKYVIFNVRRKRLFEDVLKKMNLFFSDSPLCRFKVEFSSLSTVESAVDDGGPGREMISLFYKDVCGKLTHGEFGKQVFIHDLEKLRKREFFYFGQLVALALLMGYDPPNMFCKGLSGYMLGMKDCLCSYKDVCDVELKQKIEDINVTVSEEDFQSKIYNFLERFDFGYNKFSPKLKDKQDLVKMVSHHLIVSSNLEEINQFMEGLSCGGVLQSLKKKPNESIALFEKAKALSPNDIKRLFEPVSRSSNPAHFEQEEDILFNLNNFIDEVACGKLIEVPVINLLDLEDETDEFPKMETKRITLEEILQFFTGSPNLPREKVLIYFNHGGVGRVTVKTCQLEVTFPVLERYSSENFSENFATDIVESPGFGVV